MDAESETSRARVRVGWMQSHMWMQSQRLSESDVESETIRVRVRVRCGPRVRFGWMQSQTSDDLENCPRAIATIFD